MMLEKLSGYLIFNYNKIFEHPFKQRILSGLIKLHTKYRKKTLTIPYQNKTWIEVDLNDYVDRTIFQKGGYENEIFENLSPFINNNEILWDIGAHIGSFTLKALHDKNVKQIHCFEPSPANFKRLESNKTINRNPQKMVLHPVGLGNDKGELWFYQSENNNSGGSRFVNIDQYKNAVKRPVDSVDNLIFDLNVPAPTLLKIDVEGFEAQVLDGAKKLFETHPPKALIFETLAVNNTILSEQIVEFLKKFNYTPKHITVKDEEDSELQNFLAIRNI